MGKFSHPRGDNRSQNIPRDTKPKPPIKTEESFDSSMPEWNADFQREVPRTPAKKVSSSRNKNRKIVLISLCSVAAVLLLGILSAVAYLIATDPNDGKILNNVSVAGVNVGNMSRSEAKAAIRAATEHTYTQQDMIVEFPDAQIRLSPKNTGATLDIEAAVDAAYEYGRVGTKEEKEQALAASMNAEHPIALLPYLTLNLDYIRRELDDYGIAFNSDYAPASVTLEGEMPILDANDEDFDPEAPCQTLVINTGTPGRYIDMNKAYAMVLDAYSFNQFLVVIPMEQEETVPEEVDLDAIAAEYITPAQDASVDKETYEVTMEIYGYAFDVEKAQELLDASRYGDVIELPMTMVAPEVLGGPFREVLFRDILCEFKTEHTNDERRNTNLTLACAAINGLVLDPGEEFDFNTVVGKRTTEKGYRYAAAYSSGKTVLDIGGGVCQVSSTLYYCTLIADLEIINRQPHSYISSYMDPGMDATVNWGGPDFTFRNSTNYPIRIEMWVADGYVHCKLLGTDEKDYYVEMEYDIIGYQTAGAVVEVYPSDNPEGYKDGEVIQTAYNGCTVQTYKLKYDKQTLELISKEKDQISKYKKRDKITVSIQDPTEPPTEAPAPVDPPDTPPADSSEES